MVTLDEYMVILQLAWTVCTAQYQGTAVQANPPAQIHKCALQKERCLKKAKYQRQVKACLEP
jgi:hypothetical protein